MKKFGVAATIACVLVASAPGAVVAVNSGDFVSPVFLTLGNSGQVNPPNAYTEAGVSITSPNPFYVYTEGETGLNIIDLYAQVNSEVSLNLSFTDTVLRFGFEAGDLGTTIPMEFYGIDSVEFYSDDAFTNLVDTYSTPAIMGPGATFYGLQPDTPFRSMRINFSNQTDDGGFSPYLDDFRFDAQVPEPATFGTVFAIAAIGGMLVGRRRKQV